jgi:lipid-binding SYLF domain-containing protein
MRMRFAHTAFAAATAACLLAASTASADDHRAAEIKQRLSDAHTALREIFSSTDKGIPTDLLQAAECAVIVPGLKKGGLVVAAQYGKGFMTCRTGSARSWSAPANVRVEGGSIGLQAGAGEVDMFLLVMNEAGAKELLKSEFKLGGEASVMAGPVGRSSQASTDAFMRAKMLAWSHSRGVFAGIALQGSTLREDMDDNTALYGRPLTNQQIIEGNLKPPDAAAPMLSILSNQARPATAVKK